MKSFLLPILIILFSISSYSAKNLTFFRSDKIFLNKTEINKKDTAVAKEYLNKGNEFAKDLKYDSSLIYFDKAKTIYENENLWNDYFNCINLIGSALREKGEVDKLF